MTNLKARLEKVRDEMIANCGVTKGTEMAGAIQTGFDACLELLWPALITLSDYSRQTVTVIEGRCRLNFNGNSEGPGLNFYEGEEWLSGDRAKDALTALHKRLDERGGG